jgi:dihydroneopterin aldolase
MDTLSIEQLSVHTHVGIYDWEQKILQQVLIDVLIPCDVSNCKDHIKDILDYEALCSSITSYVESNSFQLIEHLANCVAQLINDQFKVGHVTVSVTKPRAINNAGVIKISITRTTGTN